MKLRNSYDNNYYVYIKDKEDYLNTTFMLNVIDIKSEIENVLKYIVAKSDEPYIKYVNRPLLRDEYYTNGEKIYHKEDLKNINQLLELVKDKPLFPLVDGTIINEPLNFDILNNYLKNGYISYNPDLTNIVNKITEDIFKVILIEDNVDKDYITNDLGIKIPMEKSIIKDWFSYKSDNITGYEVEEILNELDTISHNENIDTIYLEDKFMLDSIEYAYHIAERIDEEIGLTNKNLLTSAILDVTNRASNKIMQVIDKTNILRFSNEVKINDNILVVYKYLPYSSLRAKVIKKLLEKEEL